MGADLQERCAIVTGAGAGNGRAIALSLAGAGAAVVCADNREAPAQETVSLIGTQGGRGRAVVMDVADAAACRRAVAIAVEEFGSVDILVNNAGILVRGGLMDLSEAEWDRAYAVNVKGGFLMTQAAGRELRRAAGAVVMVASLAGLRGSGSHLAYSSSKHAVVGMTRCLALELAADGVRVNAVCPGLVETDMIRDRAADLPARLPGYPLGRIGQPEDVARAVLHLVSAEAAWTTGLCYALDGGAGLSTRL